MRDGSIIPHVPVAQSTDKIDWNKIELKKYQVDAPQCKGLLFKPGDDEVEILIRN